MNIYSHKFIVFGEEHYNPLGVIRSLGEQGIKPIGIFIKNKIQFASKSKYLRKVHYVENREQGFDVLMKIYSNCKKKPFIYVCDDTTVQLLDNNYDKLKEHFFFFNAGSSGKISEYLNKQTIGNLALKHGLNFLNSMVVKNGQVPEGIEYPVITKAIDSTVGGWKNDMFICKNETELKEVFPKIKSQNVMIQRYIVKKNEYCLEGFSCNKGNDVFISIESIYNYRLPMSYSPYMTVNNFRNKNNVFLGLNKMFEEIGFEGIFEIEFLEANDGTLYFGEINFRNSTWSYASTCARMNLPMLWAKSMLENKIPDNCLVKIPEPGFVAMVEVTDFKERVINRKYPLHKWLFDLRKCKCRYYIGKRDLRPVLWLMWSRIITR